MVKTNINITLDVDAYLEARTRNINLSKLLSDFLKDYLNITTKPINKSTLSIEDQERKLKIKGLALKQELSELQIKKKAKIKLIAQKDKGVKWLD